VSAVLAYTERVTITWLLSPAHVSRVGPTTRVQ